MNPNEEVHENIHEIEKFINSIHPRSKMRQEVHEMIRHTSDLTYADMVQNMTRAAKECEFVVQSGSAILTGMLVNSCQSVEMNKWLSDNTQEIANMTTIEDFNIAVRNAHNEMTLNKGLPQFDGKGLGQSQTNMNSVGTDKNGSKEWMRKFPCFKCGELGHLISECPKKPEKCKEENCDRKHTAKAHKTWWST